MRASHYCGSKRVMISSSSTRRCYLYFFVFHLGVDCFQRTFLASTVDAFGLPGGPIQWRPQLRTSVTPVVPCLFATTTTTTTPTQTTKNNKVVFRKLCEHLSSNPIRLPFQIQMQQFDKSLNRKGESSLLTLRLVQIRDVPTLAEMCVQEYGSGPALFPYNQPHLVKQWFERQALYVLVAFTTLCKLNSNPDDHAVMVLCSCSDTTITNNNTLINTNGECLVGMVEVSKQPVLPHRNPPPYPLPQLVKRIRYGPLLQGWISNLLIVPNYRGRGYSKLLVSASEGMARQWQCQSIHLHCDPDEYVATKLYRTMMYHELRNHPTNRAHKKKAIPWMPGNIPPNQVLVDGVPLLYLYKYLTPPPPTTTTTSA